jgi:hypothetical protein
LGRGGVCGVGSLAAVLPHVLPSNSLPHFFSFDSSAVFPRRFLPHFRPIVSQ